MKAIITTYHGPTDHRPSRIQARDEDGNRVYVTVDNQTSGKESQSDTHARAVAALVVKMGWGGGTWTGGGIPGGYAWVNTSRGFDPMKHAIPADPALDARESLRAGLCVYCGQLWSLEAGGCHAQCKVWLLVADLVIDYAARDLRSAERTLKGGGYKPLGALRKGGR